MWCEQCVTSPSLIICLTVFASTYLRLLCGVVLSVDLPACLHLSHRSYGKTKHKFAISTPPSAPLSGSKRITFQSLFGGSSNNSNSGSGRSGSSGSSSNNSNSNSGGGGGGKKGVVFYCAASCEEEKEQWMTVIRDAVSLLASGGTQGSKGNGENNS